MLQRGIGLVGMLLLGLALAAEGGQAGGHTLSILDSSTSYNREVSGLLIWVMIFAALVFVVVIGALTLTVLRYRKTGKEVGEPPQFHGNDRLEVIWTVIPTVIVLIIFGLTARSMFKLDKVPPGAMTVEVTGLRYWWDFKYPEQGIRNSNELILPVNKPVVFKITSTEANPAEAVLHSFWPPSLVGKHDAIPGIVTSIWVTPEKLGDYYGQCAELCGASHSNMRFRIKVVSQEDFDRFVAAAKAYQAPTPTDPTLVQGESLFKANCAVCHTINGVSKPNTAYPDLTFFGNRTTVGAGMWENKPEYLEPWIKNSPGMKPGSKMPAFAQLSNQDVKAIAAYLLSHKLEGVDFSSLQKY